MQTFEHTIRPPIRGGIPLVVKVTCAFADASDALDHWTLAVNNNVLSVANRDLLLRLLRTGPARGEISGDGIGVKWQTADWIVFWDQHRSWQLTRKQAARLSDDIHLAIGRSADSAKPKTPDPIPLPEAAPVTDLRDHQRIAELEAEIVVLKKLLAFYRQYAPT